jgi:pimeloyl-[acyl-carrier protein] methyl ester esterase
MNKTTVFGGWAVSPETLKNTFGNDAEYIDVNRVMPELFDGSRRLRGDWADIVISECQLTGGNAPDVLAGWSTGAMFAYAAACVCHPRKLILLSATPCFCRKGDFRFGARPSVIDRMISALTQGKDAVLQSFYERCGLEYNAAAIPDYSVNELSLGLAFLKQADLRPLAPQPINPIFYHGQNDEIIPVSASKYFCEQTGGEHITVGGGHLPAVHPNCL